MEEKKMVGADGFEPTHSYETRFTVWGASPTAPHTLIPYTLWSKPFDH